MLIDPESGKFRVKALSITPSQSLSEVHLPENLVAERVGSRAAHLDFYVHDKGHKFDVKVVYLDERLFMITLQIESSDSPTQNDAAHRAYLQACYGDPPYRFDWGTIEASIDAHTGVPCVVVRFH